MQRLDSLVRGQFQVSWGKARGWIETGKIFVNGQAMRDPGAPTDNTAVIELKMNAPKAVGRSNGIHGLNSSEVIYLDTQVIVVNKPSGLSTVPFKDGIKGHDEESLDQRVCSHLKQKRIEIVHRLDRDTSGLIVFARNQEAAKILANQFRFHTVKRRYYALAHGVVESQTIRSELVDNRGDGLRGSKPDSFFRGEAKHAVTHVRSLRVLSEMTLIECILETGRTHQIRIHLSEAGHPLVGERAYNREFRGAKVEAARIMLHAAELGFIHPTQNSPMNWTVDPPVDFMSLLGLSSIQSK